MKLDARRIPAFLRDPGPVRVVLLHGDDDGMVRHRAESLTQAVIGARDDPFRVAWLSREDHPRLLEEASAIAMLGGRRVIRVRDAADTLAPAVQQAASGGGDSLVVLEAAGLLPARSKLRALVEGLANGAVVACYPEEGKTLQDSVRSVLSEAGISLDADAMPWLLDHLGSDWAVTRGELEKLVLYARADRRLGLDDVRACVGDAASVAFDDAVFAATSGNAEAADRALERALAEGLAPVAVTRGVMGHLAKLHQARGQMAAGASADEAVRALRPPVFFKRVSEFTRALSRWDPPRLLHAMAETRRVELACKQTGAPDSLLVRRLMLALARQGATRS
ncbi:MAG: DNA polymerase III subunit delta [Acetobacteraceae bacterium]|nr:DNA polymerase III subunit delta [Acetobacteraceae bacterium]